MLRLEHPIVERNATDVIESLVQEWVELLELDVLNFNFENNLGISKIEI